MTTAAEPSGELPARRSPRSAEDHRRLEHRREERNTTMSQQSWGRRARRPFVAALAVALAVLGAAAGGAAAQAADEPSPANITGTTGTLVIHKHAGNPSTAGNGRAISDPAQVTALGSGLGGVVFSVQRVTSGGTPIDLTTAAGWDLATQATLPRVQGHTDGFDVLAQTTATTLPDGSATIPNLPYGLYLVTETSPGPNPVVSPGQPFLVSVPYPSSTDSTWLYTVNVYPKNKLNTTTPEKTVSDPNAPVLGSTVHWTITAPIPELAAGDTYRKFVVTDQLDPRLTLTGAVLTLDGAPLVAGTDYTLSPTTLPAASGPNVVITFTATGLGKLAGKTAVGVDLATTVDSLGDGKITNTAFVNVNDSVRQTGTPQTNWGPLQIIKVSAADTSKTLAGAQFTLHETKGGPQVGGVLNTDGQGRISVAGLWVGNGGTLTRSYWVHETQAPAGYALPAGDAAWTQVTVTAGDAASVVPVQVQNAQQNGPNLPLTGSTGTAMFLGGGAALILAAAGGAIVLARRRRSAAE